MSDTGIWDIPEGGWTKPEYPRKCEFREVNFRGYPCTHPDSNRKWCDDNVRFLKGCPYCKEDGDCGKEAISETPGS